MEKAQVERLSSSLDAEIIETHISWVLLVEKCAYKIKRPVKFSFLDFSTLDLRKHFCHEEVRLNSRLSPEVYLDVEGVCERNENISLGEGRKTIDYAVKMKRLPQDKRMDVMLKKDKVKRRDIEQIADIIFGFHKDVKTITDKKYGSPEIVLEQIMDLGNFRQVIDDACGLGDEVDFLLQESRCFIVKNKDLFWKRQEKGNIKDCHGDLHSANIFLIDHPIIFDCIEFSKDFRYVDSASEIAFMAMDLDSSGDTWFSELFVDRFLDKYNDEGLEEVLQLYKSYRANVRTKIAAIDFHNNRVESSKEDMMKYLKLAVEYAEDFG